MSIFEFIFKDQIFSFNFIHYGYRFYNFDNKFGINIYSQECYDRFRNLKPQFPSSYDINNIEYSNLFVSFLYDIPEECLDLRDMIRSIISEY